MKAFIKIWMIALALTALQKEGIAQTYQAAFADLQKVKKSYSDSAYMSFKILYQYSMMSAPSTIMDTISAHYKYKSGKFYCSMGPIEFTQNDSMNVALYKNDEIMIINNAFKDMNRGSMLIDGWDSSFVAENIDSIAVTNVGSNKKMQFFFKTSSAYNNCSIEYHATNYRPQKFTYIKANSMYYPDSTSKPEGVSITISFSGYSTTAFNESVFDARRFAIKQNGKWAPAAAYSSYQFVNSYFEQ